MALGDLHFPTVSAPESEVLFQDKSLNEPDILHMTIIILKLSTRQLFSNVDRW